MPSFELKTNTRVAELEGLRLSETHRIKEAKMQSIVELTHCKFQEEGLILGGPREQDYVLDESFAFVVTDTDQEEKVENLPLLVARVTP